MNRISLIIKKPLPTLIGGLVGNSTLMQLDIHPDGVSILHGDKTKLTELLADVKNHLLERKANARYADPGTLEFYSTSLYAVQEALENIDKVSVCNMPRK